LMVYSARTLYPKVLVYWFATAILLTKRTTVGVHTRRERL